MPPNDPNEKLLLSAKETAALLGVSPCTIWRQIHGGQIPAPCRIAGRVLFRREELEAWIRSGCPNRQRWTWPEGGGR